MQGRFNKICAKEGGAFDCYLVVPEIEKPVAAVVLASAIHGVDADMRAIADELAAYGFIVGGAGSVLAFDCRPAFSERPACGPSRPAAP